MYNTARTLLANIPYRGQPADHIPEDFRGIILSSEMQTIHNLIFGEYQNSTDEKLEVVDNLLRVIDGAGLSKSIEELDPKISYNLRDDLNFSYNKNSDKLDFDLAALYSRLKSSNTVLNFVVANHNDDVTEFVDLWFRSPFKLYALAGFLVFFIKVLHNLWQT